MGEVSDGYLSRSGLQRGWATVIWRGRHIVEPTEITPAEACQYWLEVLTVARAMEHHYRPKLMNYQFMGNGSPHLHAILTARFEHDIAAGRPIPAERGQPFPEELVARDRDALRAELGYELTEQ